MSVAVPTADMAAGVASVHLPTPSPADLPIVLPTPPLAMADFVRLETPQVRPIPPPKLGSGFIGGSLFLRAPPSGRV